MQSYGPQPPAGQQAIGVLNIVFGVIGLVFGLLILMGGAFLAALGGMVGASGPDTAPVGGIMSAGGVFTVLLALGFIAVNALGIAGGVGILKMAPWGRSLSLIYAWIAVALNVVQLLLTGFSATLCSLVGIIYPVVLLVLLNQPDWKAAFGEGGR